MSKFFEKNLNRAIVFLCIAAALVVVCFRVFSFSDKEKTDTMMNQFYELNDNSVECVFFGSSVTQRAYVTPVAYHEYGIPAYIMGSSSQPFVTVKYLMKEVLKTQKPKVFVVELKAALKTPDQIEDIAVRKSLDVMKQSLNRFRAVKAVTDYAATGDNNVDKSGLTYYIPFFKYHYLWNPSKRPHKYGDIDYYNGYSPNLGLTFRVRKMNIIDYDDHVEPVGESQEKVFNDLLDFCDTLEDTKVLFVMHPVVIDEHELGEINYLMDIADERGYEVLNFIPAENREAIGLDDRTCYYNTEHFNYYGALKYTDFLSDYMIKNYGVTDRRGDKDCQVWEDEYNRLSDDLKGKYAEKYDEMVRKVNKIEEGR